LYDIGVHICFPGTILSPMLAEENKTKPQVTKKIEETDAGLPPLAIAMALLQGVESGHFHISVDLITHIFRASTRGSTPWNSIFDFGYELIGSVSHHSCVCVCVG
jgi:3-dehydrosphinganine reductase